MRKKNPVRDVLHHERSTEWNTLTRVTKSQTRKVSERVNIEKNENEHIKNRPFLDSTVRWEMRVSPHSSPTSFNNKLRLFSQGVVTLNFELLRDVRWMLLLFGNKLSFLLYSGVFSFFVWVFKWVSIVVWWPFIADF